MRRQALSGVHRVAIIPDVQGIFPTGAPLIVKEHV